MDLPDEAMGGVAAVGVATVVSGLIEKHGGLLGLVSQFERQGFGEAVKSWVGKGPNQPITYEQLREAIGPLVLNQMARNFGLSPQDLTQKLVQALPQAVDKLTPGGVLPKA